MRQRILSCGFVYVALLLALSVVASAQARQTTYQGDARQPNYTVSLFLSSGADGRSTTIGIKLDDYGFLVIADGATGTIWLHDTHARRLLYRFETGLGTNNADWYVQHLNPRLFLAIRFRERFRVRGRR